MHNAKTIKMSLNYPQKSFNLLFLKSVGFMDFCALFVKVCPNRFKL